MGLVRQKGKASAETRRKRRLRFFRTRLRELKMIAKALVSDEQEAQLREAFGVEE